MINRSIVTEGSFGVVKLQAKLKMLVVLNRNNTVPSITLVRNNTEMLVLMRVMVRSSSNRSKVVVVAVINKVQILINLTIIREPIISVIVVRDTSAFDRVEQEP